MATNQPDREIISAQEGQVVQKPPLDFAKVVDTMPEGVRIAFQAPCDRGRRQDPRKDMDRRMGELRVLVDSANTFRVGTPKIGPEQLPPPTMHDFFAAQKMWHENGGREQLRDEAHLAITALLAEEIAAAGGIPSPTLATKNRLGKQLNELVENLGMGREEGNDFVKDHVLPALSEAERNVLFPLVSIERKMNDWEFPDTDTCTEETIAAYLMYICYGNHGKEIQVRKDFTPTQRQDALLSNLMEKLSDRVDGGVGMAAFNLRKVIELIGDKNHRLDILGRLARIVHRTGDYEHIFRVLTAAHQETSALSDRILELGEDEDALKIIHGFSFASEGDPEE